MGTSKPKIRLICYAWGEAYVDRLLSYAAAAALAPGNLPALTRVFDCTFVILTEQRLFEYVHAHPVAQHIEALCPLRLLPLDDLIGEPWQYGLTVAYSLFRGITDLGSDGTNTYCLFLNADFVLADGCYEVLIPRILGGEHLHLSPSYCVAEERVLSSIEAHRDPVTRALAIPKRDMAHLILDHRHNTVRAKTVNQDLFHFKYMDQFYWRVDPKTLIGHQMPIAMIGVRPEVVPADLNTFWDWGVVYELCPSKKLTVLGDSDDFLMLELRAEATHQNLLCAGRDSPSAMASRMTGYITQYQVDNAEFPLTLHSADLPDSLAPARAALRAIVEEVLSHLPSKPIDHANHEQWLYHKRHFKAYAKHLAAYASIRELEGEIVRLEKARNRLAAERPDVLELVEADDSSARAALVERAVVADLLAAEIAKRREKIRNCRLELALKAKLAGRANDPDQTGHVKRGSAGLGLVDLLAGRASLKQHIFNLLMGEFRDIYVWHPLYAGYAELLARSSDFADGPCLFVVGPKHHYLQPIADRFGRSLAVVMVDDVLQGAKPELLAEADKPDCCAIVLSGADRSRLTVTFASLEPLLKNGSRVLVHWVNSDAELRGAWESDLVRFMADRPSRMEVSYAGSFLTEMAMRHYRRVRASAGRSLKLRLPWVLMNLAAAMVYSTLDYCVQGRRRGATSVVPPFCASVTMEFGHNSTHSEVPNDQYSARVAEVKPTQRRVAADISGGS